MVGATTEWDNNFRSLMARVREGSEDAAWELVNEYGDAIRRAVRRVLNERMRSKFDSLDFVQIVWNSLFRVRDKLERFDRPEELTAYLVAMAHNKVGMEVRRRLMTQKYNVGHEESLDQRHARGCSDVASPTTGAHRCGHCPRTVGSFAPGSAAALSADHPVAVAGAYVPKHRRCRSCGRMHGASFSQEIAPHSRPMTADISTSRHGSTLMLAEERGLPDAGRVVDAIKRRWRQGEVPDMNGELTRHPELRRYRSLVLDLAYAEYQQRQQAGEPIDAETFARRFPSLERSLYLLIEVHGLLSQDPDLQLLQDSLLWPEAGSRFLQFDLVVEIGRGAFGRVFLATEPALGGRQIVVKIAPHGGGEAEILGKLRHPNIVPVYSLQEDKTTGLAAFCMPYLGRATLCDVLDHVFLGGPPPRKRRAILDANRGFQR